VVSGVPQGSVLGPLLFIIYINDLPDKVKNCIKLYADDGKLIVVIDLSELSSNTMQEDINNIVQWCNDWSMELNASKCEVIHYGKNNPHREYTIQTKNETENLKSTDLVRDLGVLMSSDGEWTQQISASVNKANQTLGRIKNGFRYYTSDIAKIIYPTFVRPHLEYASAIWHPSKVKDIKLMENVQHRATKTCDMVHLGYEQRLDKLDLMNLQMRRKRGDLIQCYKIVKRIDNIRWRYSDNIFMFDLDNIDATELRRNRNNFRFLRELDQSRVRQNFLLNRIATTWNNLPVNVIGAPSLNSFKARIDEYLRNKEGRTSIYSERSVKVWN
jgi:hypothetical protein